ncbi:MoaF C-terminal domain-containing protein [Rhodococcus sp. NPDC060176]|uniref:MoaF C-terminal domain-containing protein n=1 Tax=Rhodococcus sp. NPDC060176 TaxID=3347062 RepID=UPI00365A9FD5
MHAFNLSEQQYIPLREFNWRVDPDGGGVGEEFEDGRWPASTSLDGKSYDLSFVNGWKIRHEFNAGATMTWTVLEGQGKGETGTQDSHTVEVRPNIFAVTFSKGEPREDILLVVDTERSRALAVVTTFGPGYFEGDESLPEANTVFLSGAIGDAEIVELHPSDVLVSQRAIHFYSEHQVYEHVYLSKHTNVWQCLVGPERGETDVAETDTYVFDDDLLIFKWHERGAPADGILVVDRVSHRTTGRLSGSDGMLVMGARSYFTAALEYPSLQELANG